MEDCIFCKIAKKELPCYMIYEDDTYISFLDIFPRVKGHALVIPKKHYRWVYDVPEYGEFWEVTKKIAVKIQKNLNCEYISFVTVGNEVPHAHIHIIPQWSGTLEGFHFGDVVATEKIELEKLAEKLIK
ncbi:MAG: Histidine triad (HIT) protein [Candidatus Roizmanbacteria bacterium GW2011_GWA2_37_7]|uniref:Histidine triad (HIT) protein n=1 Tax=Candidatus Roizmanbacteria bacterium GW2011_GWA2_37_7 TaxID=1618481 RepID=A0A0G0JJU4_9BACT|nr:MAG: Histidine triad (HIT) protein [Candidatus Roizmanbacteria bacterium GW2011_GWA2_37_7]